MWIQELHLKNFGKFYNETILLEPGINLIYGENESGKSTIHTFIKGCFYGIRKLRGRAAKTDVFSRYQPWENPAYYAGSIRFVCAKKVFRLERDFTKGCQTGTLICETDGERLSLENGDLEMLLGNVGESAFDNTVSVGQLKNETDEGLIVELKNYMANYEGTADASIRVEKALHLLKEKEKSLKKQQAEELAKENEKIEQIITKIRFLKEEKNEMEVQLHQIKKKKQECGEEIERKQRLLEKLKAEEWKKMSSEEAADFENGKKPGIFARLIRLIRNLFSWLFGKKKHKERETKQTNSHSFEKKPSEAMLLYEKEVQRLSAEKDKLSGRMEHLQEQIQEKGLLIENGQQDIQMQKDRQLKDGKSALQTEIEACALAASRIKEVVSQMQNNVGAFLKKKTSEIFCEITEGRYRFVEVAEDLTMGVFGEDHFIPIEQLSRGTIWQLYFALRMAANEVLCQEEELPVILDDAFAMYDEERLGQVLFWLAKQEKQVILFTCQKRELEWMRKTKTEFHEVCLKR